MFNISENTINYSSAVTDASIVAAAELPVVFYDGEREIDLGKVQILTTMTFKGFQSLLSSKIGISPHQITIYFERRHNNHLNNHHRRRHPVTNKFDFSALISDHDLVTSSFFWVVLKRARRNRRRRNGGAALKSVYGGGGGDVNDGFVLLRRDVNHLVYMEQLNRIRMMYENIERHRENYLMSVNLNCNVYNELSSLNVINEDDDININNLTNNNHYYYDDYSGDYRNDRSAVSRSSGDDHDYDGASCSTGGGSSDRVFCDVCNSYSGFGEAAPFHWCKNDTITMGFRSSPAGPIAPPSKNKLLGRQLT